MATAKQLKEWQERERILRASLAIAERGVKRDTEALAKTKAYRNNCERLLEEHLANAPTLTPKQAASLKSS